MFGEASSGLLKSTDLQALAKKSDTSFRSEFVQLSQKTPQPAVLIVLESSINFSSSEFRVQSSVTKKLLFRISHVEVILRC